MNLDDKKEIREFASGVRFLLRVLRDTGRLDDIVGTANSDPHALILRAGEIEEKYRED